MLATQNTATTTNPVISGINRIVLIPLSCCGSFDNIFQTRITIAAANIAPRIAPMNPDDTPSTGAYQGVVPAGVRAEVKSPLAISPTRNPGRSPTLPTIP